MQCLVFMLTSDSSNLPIESMTNQAASIGYIHNFTLTWVPVGVPVRVIRANEAVCLLLPYGGFSQTPARHSSAYMWFHALNGSQMLTISKNEVPSKYNWHSICWSQWLVEWRIVNVVETEWRDCQIRLGPPPTSVPSGRLFSAAGEVISGHRNALLPDNAARLIFMKYNIKLTDDWLESNAREPNM